MLWTIAKKELTQNLMEVRFFLILAVTVLLFAVSGVVSLSRYFDALERYHQLARVEIQELRESAMSLRQLFDHQQTLYLKPCLLEFLISGRGTGLSDSIQISPRFVIAETLSVKLVPGNPLIERFTPIGWIFIVGAILSFGAVVFSYDSISREKEEGILALMLANPVRRSEILLGKFLGIYLTIIIPLLVGVILSLLIVATRFRIGVHPEDGAKIGLVLLIALVYLAGFAVLGIMVSALTHNSSNSFVILFLLWALFLVIIPEAGNTAGRLLQPTKNSSQLLTLAQKAVEEVDNKYKDRESGVDFSQPFSERTKIWVDFINERMRAARRVYDDHLHRALAQAATARAFSRLSPASTFDYAVENIAGIGLERTQLFLESVRSYRRALLQFIVDRDRMDPESPHLLFSFFLSKNPVDPHEIPLFDMSEPRLIDSMRKAFFDVSLLMGFLFFVVIAAYIAFARYDAR